MCGCAAPTSRENVLEQTYNRMKSERNALAQDIRSQGEATKTRMNAETDRTYTVKLAEARKQSEIFRGEGEAERNKVFAAGLPAGPGVLQLLPFDAGLCQEPVDGGHHAGAET